MAQQTLHFGLKINADTSDARAELDRLKQVLGQLGTGTGFKFNAKQEIREASIAAQQLQKHLAAATSKTGDFDINRFTASIKKGEMSLSEMSMKLMQIGTEGTNAFRTLSTQILNAQKPALSFSNILTKMGTTLANNIRWQLSSAAINAATGSIQEAWHYTKEMDKALTNIRVVTGKSREEMDSLAKSANKMAKELRSTTQEIVKGQLIYFQQGDSMELAAEKARITTMAANVSFNSSQEEMADYLTAIWNSYKVGENELELFVDKLSAVGASTATSMEEIATGMQKVAASANAVGVTYDQLNATIATISSTTRTSAEQVGTAMKTIYARMGDLKAGKTDEDGITYGQVSTQIKKLGFDIADANGQLRDMGEVVEEIGNKWHTLSDETQQALAQAIAGKRQYTNLFALFDNWDMYLDTLETSKNAMGALQEQQDAWADSIEGASNRVKSSLENLYGQVINDDAIIDMTNGLASFLEYFTGLIDALGGLGTILPAVGGLLVSAFAPAIVSGLTSGVMNLRTLFGGWAVDLKKARDGLVEMANAPGFDRLSAEQQKLILNTRDLAIAQNQYVKNSKYMTTQQKQEAQFAMDTAQALQVTITELETASQAYKDAALASKNFSTAGGANVQNLNAGAATVAFQKAFSVVDSNQGFFSPALKQQLDDIQTKIQSGVKPSVDELRNAIIAYNNEVNNLNAGGAPANIDQLGKAFDKLMTKMSQAQAQMEGYRTLASNLKVNPGGGFTFDTKDITVANQIRQALKDVGVEASIIEQIMKDGVIPDGVLGPDIKDINSLEKAANKAEKTLNRFARLGNKKYGLPVEELRKSAKVTRDAALATEEYRAALERAKGEAKSFGTGLTTAIGGITSLIFSLSSLKSAGDAIASGDWLTGISSGLMGLTMAGSGVKSIADGLIKMHGEGGAAIQGLARSMNGMGLTFQKTGSLVTNTAMSSTTAWLSVLGPVLAVAAALAALGAAIWWVAKDMKKAETNAKSAAEQAKTFSTELENANQELTDLKNNFENYNTKQSALDKMTEGTDEFKKALQEANEEVIDLITKYPELAEYVNDVNGRLVVSVEGQNKLLKAQQAEIDRAYTNKLSSNIVAINAKQEANEQALATKVLKDKASATGETVGTALGAAAAGAAIGAFAGPIGAIIGGLVGAAAGVVGGYFGLGADDRNNKEHGLDKFTHAVETQGINIMSSYKSLENALGGDSELAQALWNNKEETSKLAKEIAANKKQIDLNTKQLIIANNPGVENSSAKGDILEIGSDMAQSEDRLKKYENEMIELLNGGSEQDAADAYLKAMYGDEASNYRIIDRAGTNSTLQKKNADGVWETQGTKSGLSDDTMIANYAAKMASSLTQAEIDAIEETSKNLKERIENYTKGNGDEIVKNIIDEYGGIPEKALKYIEENGGSYYAIFTKHLREDIDKIFSGGNSRKQAQDDALKFALEYNTAFEGLEDAFAEGDDEVLQGYLDDFQELGLLMEYDLETFKLLKNEILKGETRSGFSARVENYTEGENSDSIGKVDDALKYGGQTRKVKVETGYSRSSGEKQYKEETKFVQISASELEEKTRQLLENSGLTEYQIANIVKEVISKGKLTDEIEREIEAQINMSKAFSNSSISDITTEDFQSEKVQEYFGTLKNGKAEQQAYIDAINAMNEADFSRIEIEDDKIQFLREDGSVIKEVAKGTMAFNAVLKDGLAPLDAFSDKLGKDAYDALVDYNEEIGRTDEETNKFLDAIDNFDTETINELSKNLSEGNFESFKLEDGVLTFYDKYGEKIQEVGGELEDLEALAKSIDPTFKATLDIDIKDTLAGLKEDKTKIEKEISSWDLDFSKPITLTREQQTTISNFLPNVDWSAEKRRLENGYYKTIDEFTADINNKKFESIAINLDIETTATDPQILYDYADALGVPKEKADELKVAFQELADNGIAYATRDENGIVHYFDAMGEEIFDVGNIAEGSTAQLIALGKDGIKPLSSYPGLSEQVYNSIINAGTAAGWSKDQINNVLTAMSTLSKYNLDLSQPIESLMDLEEEARKALVMLFSAAGLQFKVDSNLTDATASAFFTGAEVPDGTYYRTYIVDREGNEYATINEAITATYKKLGLTTTGGGYVPPPTEEEDPNEEEDPIVDPGDTDPGDGEEKSPEAVAFENAMKNWENFYSEGQRAVGQNRKTAQQWAKDVHGSTLPSEIKTAYNALSAEEKEEYKSDFYSVDDDIQAALEAGQSEYYDELPETEDVKYKSQAEIEEEVAKIYSVGSDDYVKEVNRRIASEMSKKKAASPTYTGPTTWTNMTGEEASIDLEKVNTSGSDAPDYDVNKVYRENADKIIENAEKDLEKGIITYGQYRNILKNQIYRQAPDGSFIFTYDERMDYLDNMVEEDPVTALEGLDRLYKIGEISADAYAQSFRDILSFDDIDAETLVDLGDDFTDFVSGYFDTLNTGIENGVKAAQPTIDTMKTFLQNNKDLLTNEQYIELRDQIIENIEGYGESISKGIEIGTIRASDGLNAMWQIIADNADILTKEEKESLIENITSTMESALSSTLELTKKGVYDFKTASSELQDIFLQGWNLEEINADNWNSLGDTLEETVEMQEQYIEYATGLLESTENLWSEGILSFEEGMEANLYYLEQWGFALTDAQKRIYSDTTRQLEKYIAAQKSLFDEGGQSLFETITNIQANSSYDEDLVAEKIKEILTSEFDEIIEDFEEGKIDSVAGAAEKIIAKIIESGYTDMEEINKILAEQFATLYEHNLQSIQDKYEAIELDQDVADYGMFSVDLNDDGLFTEEEFRLDQWQKKMSELLALRDSYIANYKGTESIVYDETYQSIQSAIKAEQDAGQELADAALEVRENYLDRQKRLGNVTIDDEINYLNQTQWMFDNNAFREYFANEDDYLEWVREKRLENYEAQVEAHKEKAELIKEQLIEEYETEKAIVEKQKELRETEFDAIMELREAQHQLDIDLQSSLAMYEYLDEETRKLIFNEEDYVSLSNEILRIQEEINDLTETYNDDILNATDKEAELLTEEYEQQVELKLQEFEIAKANLEVTKKQLALQNTLNERNTRMFINGQWTWVADPNSVAKAREEILEAQYNAETERLNLDHQKEMNILNDSIRSFDEKIVDVEQRFEELEEKLGNKDKGVIKSLAEFDKALTAWETKHGEGGDITEGTGFGEEGHFDRTEWEDLTNEEIYNAWADKNIYGIKQEEGSQVYYGNKVYTYSTIDKNGRMAWVDEKGNVLGQTFKDAEGNELIDSSLAPLNWDEGLQYFINEVYGADRNVALEGLVEREKAQTSESDNQPYTTQKEYTKTYETDVVNYIEQIIDLLSTLVLIDDSMLSEYITAATEASTKKGTLFRVGNKTYLSQGDKTFYDKETDKILTLQDIIDIVTGVNEKQKEEAEDNSQKQTSGDNGNNSSTPEEPKVTTEEPEATTEDSKLLGEYENNSEIGQYQGTDAVSYLWNNKDNIRYLGQGLFEITDGKGSTFAVNDSVTEDGKYFASGEKQSKVYKKGILATGKLDKDFAESLFAFIDEKYGGEQFAGLFYEQLFNAILKSTDGSWVSTLANAYKTGPEGFWTDVNTGFTLGEQAGLGAFQEGVIEGLSPEEISGYITNLTSWYPDASENFFTPLKDTLQKLIAETEKGSKIKAQDEDTEAAVSDNTAAVRYWGEELTAALSDYSEGGKGENIDKNARGNIITRPTVSWVGEDGPEAIIPLSQKYRDRGLSLWEEATKALGIAPSFTMPTIKASFPQQKENMNVSQTINVTVQNEDSSNDFYAITNLL